ncbi:PREDICTED: auxin-responsive protein SAUR71 [Theobroma cacao]|uniref:Auxin-responsive protein SAUR71 n=1 Tax=Theobroma cacao TaxID=3641 RepID=A0AB32WKF9_THECC|nr:PREDICTED: auxin-responsive protein SAUR71 [Theobroma cacao]
MNHGKMMKHQACHITRTKNFLGLWQFRAQHHPKLPVVPGKSHKILGSNYEEMSKESLLTAELSDGSNRGSVDPTQVPKGFIAVYVGPELRRFVIPMSYLSMPEFKILMDKVAEEFGFEQEGGLQIPCDEQHFEQILLKCTALQQMSKNKNKNNKKIIFT